MFIDVHIKTMGETCNLILMNIKKNLNFEFTWLEAERNIQVCFII